MQDIVEEALDAALDEADQYEPYTKGLDRLADVVKHLKRASRAAEKYDKADGLDEEGWFTREVD